MPRYKAINGPMPTTAAQAVVTTGTSIKTLLQLKTFNVMKVKAWGVSFDGAAAAAGIKCELLDTVFGTVTAYVDADLYKLDGADQAVASVMGLTVGTAASGYTCTNEGSVTATKVFDAQLVQPTNQYAFQWPLGDEPTVVIGNCLRIRVTAAAAVNAYAWVEVSF